MPEPDLTRILVSLDLQGMDSVCPETRAIFSLSGAPCALTVHLRPRILNSAHTAHSAQCPCVLTAVIAYFHIAAFNKIVEM